MSDIHMMVQLLVSGLAMGAIYGLVALSFAVIYRATGAVNFATGDFVMVPAVLVAVLIITARLSSPWAYAIALVFWAACGVVFYRLVFHPVRRRPQLFLVVAIATLGVSGLLKNGVQIAFGPRPMSVPSPLSVTAVRVAGISVSSQSVLIVIVAAILFTVQYLLFEKTIIGKQMRATAQDREMAALVGIGTAGVLAFTFVYSSALGAIAGILVAPIFYVGPQMGFMIGLKAFSASVLGGFGSVPGAILGGLTLGVVEMFGAAYVSGGYKDAIAFILMILILLIRPQGLFGEGTAERA